MTEGKEKLAVFVQIVNLELAKRMWKIVQRKRKSKKLEDNFAGEGNI